ncbi:anti-sigma factor [Paenibacillus radicis (ex Xue et al. 2023)]|uniref:Regulator of SigK n=1 Tax=Paenibacillus radicis (ex Xue et al. 2023) TaxID=2972489 RepID=A0ABT1YNY6_9BACL|nr:anti-sigma factor [Paenibacillus radicis (ex Xue et al. 2023)]MCR8634893.1 anti-sigma factor [Paenibacillus radicis (ex Xue et al. 2023)]
MTEGNNLCEQVFPYFLKELPPEEEETFKLHLSSCQVCRDELIELEQIWRTLPFEMEEVELQDSVKEQMLNHILQEIHEPVNSIGQIVTEPEAAPLVNKIRSTPRRSRWSFAAAAVVCILIGATVGWGLNEYGIARFPSGSKIAAPAQVVEQYALKAFDPNMPAAKGHCWIKQQGQQQQLVVQVNGLRENAGDQAYQVWIVKKGTRFNGGTFRVNDDGSGLLTHDLNPAESEFDTIGITLEPDAVGSKPRGKKVLGS